MEDVTTMNKMYLTKIVAASLLGDGCVTIPKDGSINASYGIRQTEPHKDYLNWLADRLNDITYVRREGPFVMSKYIQNAKDQYGLKTRTHPFFTKFRERMYPNGHKVVDPHYLTLMDWEFLAIWYQDDGHITSRMQGNYQDIQVGIATQSFSYGDNLLLKQALKEKLYLEWNIRQYKNKTGAIKYHLALRRTSLERFIDGVMPFIVPSFQYKVQTIVPLKKGEEIV